MKKKDWVFWIKLLTDFHLNYTSQNIITRAQVYFTFIICIERDFFSFLAKMIFVKYIGTKLEKRLKRGDKGINPLDELCKEHDIFYSNNKDSNERRKADKKLASGALERVFAKDSSLGERAASLLVSSAMGVKTGLSKLGMGIPCLNYKPKKKKNLREISFNALVKDARDGIKKSKAKTIPTAIRAALRYAKKSTKGKRVKVPRIIKVPSISGGVLPLLPILAGLSTVGSLVGATAGVVKTIKDIKSANAQLAESKRHNRAIEQKIGAGLYLGTRSNGRGLYLRPSPNFTGHGFHLSPFKYSKN